MVGDNLAFPAGLRLLDGWQAGNVPEIDRLKDVFDAWKKRVSRHQIFQVILESVSRKEFRRQIAPALVKVRGVQQNDEGVKMRGIVNNIVTAEIYWAYDLDTLADALEDLAVEGMSFEIVEQSANRIRAKVVRN